MPTIARTAGQPTHTSRREEPAAKTMASAATSGWKIGGTGWGWRGSVVLTWPNCGVLTAGSWTIEIRTWDLSCSSSQRTDSVNPWIACLAPQYADWSGMPR